MCKAVVMLFYIQLFSKVILKKLLFYHFSVLIVQQVDEVHLYNAQFRFW